MTLLLWVAGLALAFALASTLALYSYGRFARRSRGPVSHALPRATDATALDRLIGPLESRHPGRSGLALVLDNAEALGLMVRSARLAGRSLDLMYYIWRDDTGGRLIARELIAAADRGVRVRLLLDDVNVQGFDPKFIALDKHPRIEVRLFNPIRARRGMIGRGIEMLLGLVRFNRRMHCKLWLADGRLAMTGGRNIGSIYLANNGRRPVSCDADLLMLGKLVQESESFFDRYWNSGIALPMTALWKYSPLALGRLRARLDREARGATAQAMLGAIDPVMAGHLPADAGGLPLLPPAGRLHWTERARMLSDPPEKALGHGRDRWLPEALYPALAGARRSLHIVTPYFVPGREGMTQLAGLARRGVAVRIVTNALAATDHAIVHGAYRRYRRPLLAAGASLYEFVPGTSEGRQPEMLHSKLFVADDAACFVGSFNFDLRSAFLNTEMGIYSEDPGLVAEVLAECNRLSAPERAWRLRLDGRVLRWQRAEDGSATAEFRDPEAPALRRGASWVIGHLPIHSQL